MHACVFVKLLVIQLSFFCSLPQCAKKAHCDFGLYVGAGPDNAETVPLLSNEALAMKMYLNKTFTSLRLDSMETWMKVSFGVEL